MITADDLSKVVVAEDSQGNLTIVGQLIGYGDTPTAFIRQADGSQQAWRADMTRLATPTEVAIVQTLAPAQNECFHDMAICGRLTYTKTATLCGRCKKVVEA